MLWASLLCSLFREFLVLSVSLFALTVPTSHISLTLWSRSFAPALRKVTPGAANSRDIIKLRVGSSFCTTLVLLLEGLHILPGLLGPHFIWQMVVSYFPPLFFLSCDWSDQWAVLIRWGADRSDNEYVACTVKVKVKVTLVQVTKAQRGSRDRAPLFL